MTIMKKILLIAAVALVTLGASATNRKYLSKASIAKEGKIVKATPGAFKSNAAKFEAANAFYNMSNHKTGKVGSLKAQRRAGDELELIPAYSETVYKYTDILGGEVKSHMYDEASFLVTEDGKAYLAPFDKLDYVEGVLTPEADNEYAEIGAVVYTFTCDTIAHYTNKTTNEEKSLVLGVCDFEGSSQEGWTPVRTDAKTFIGYYFAEYNELYIEDAIALFEADETVKEIFDEGYFVESLDLEPQSIFSEYMSKANFSNISYFDDPGTPAVTGECVAYVGNPKAIYVQGADAAGTDGWVQYALDAEVENRYHVGDYQLLGFGRWYNDATRTDTHRGVLVTMSVAVADGAVVSWSVNDEADFDLVQNADETLTIKSTADTGVGAYVFMEEGYSGGNYDQLNQTVNILLEPIEEAGVNMVKADAANNAALYNLAGQKVGKDFKGLVIKNGKKFVQK